MASNEQQINSQIRDKEIRVIGPDGEQIGIMPTEEAMKIAEEKDLDLVKVAPMAKPPVCRIMDHGKYLYEQSKREKEARRNQHVVEIKEVRLGPNTDIGDFNTKVRHAIRFLKEGNKVKVSMRFRGREMGHTDIGYESMKKFAEACEEYGEIESRAKMDGRQMIMFLAPHS